MGLLDELFNNLGDITESLQGISVNLKNNAKKIKKTGKIRLEIVKEEKKLKDTYEELGRLYYDKFYNNKEVDLDGLALKIEPILARIMALENSLKLAMQESDISDDNLDVNSKHFEENYNKENKRESYIYIDEEDLK
ncbi:hypothetical protein J2S72_000529 [Peptoniphilus koenoeneniae]|uniref:Uncharacterized protein n=1 Tax=Peptoniphilus koenoeneniae TaxID=507751 RepID=A0ABU0AUQ2_9FIRM|nr:MULTISPECIES: hypothetical protein [Peptoniphilus]ERT59077.1 hypothetical protein HMPREF1253_1964 [Peptoniphilus sp. BV3C26]MDQ0274521.1 hypothetical protein [Peptoniphilus koenoeneniae]